MTHVHTIPPHGGDALMHRPFQITVAHADQARAQVRATGPLDRSTVDLLTAVLEAMLGWGRRHVRLDLSSVTVSDQECLPALLRVHEMFLAEHGLLVLTSLSPDLAGLLRRRRLERALFIAEEPQERWPEQPCEHPFDSQASVRGREPVVTSNHDRQGTSQSALDLHRRGQCRPDRAGALARR